MQSLFASLDWQYMFLGDAPPSFLFEIAVRTVIIYAYSLALIRWIGGRGIAQMSVVEFLLVVALGSAVGDAMFYPDVPLIHAMLVITLVCAINKLIDIGMCASPTVRRIFSGRTVAVVHDGRVDLAALRHLKVSREELFEGLRTQGISNIGRIENAYLEAGGSFSVFRRKGTASGLPIVPPPSAQEAAGPSQLPSATAGHVCTDCGARPTPGDAQCRHCAGSTFVPAAADTDQP